jgi:hypothetical protein
MLGYRTAMCLNTFLLEDGARRAELPAVDLVAECLSEPRRAREGTETSDPPFDWSRTAEPKVHAELVAGVENAWRLLRD